MYCNKIVVLYPIPVKNRIEKKNMEYNLLINLNGTLYKQEKYELTIRNILADHICKQPWDREMLIAKNQEYKRGKYRKKKGEKKSTLIHPLSSPVAIVVSVRLSSLLIAAL